jgi:hypothetical protein
VRATLCEGRECGRVVHFGGTARCVLIYSHFSPPSHPSPRHISKFSSAELITTTSIHIAMILEEFPQFMEFISYEHTPFSTAGSGSCRPNFGHAGESITSCPATCVMNCTPCVDIHTEHSLPQISKRIPREASQGERGSDDSGREQRKCWPVTWPLQEGPQVLA